MWSLLELDSLLSSAAHLGVPSSLQLDAFDLGLVTSDEFTNADVLEETYRLLGDNLRALVAADGGAQATATAAGDGAVLNGPSHPPLSAGAAAEPRPPLVVPVVTGFLGKVRAAGGREGEANCW